MLRELSKFTLILGIALFVVLAMLEYLYRGFVSYFFDIRIIFSIILISLTFKLIRAKI